MKRTLLTLAVPLGLMTLLPPASAQVEGVEGFHGFGSFATRAQGQVAEATAYLNAFREDDRIMGALSEINGPPANSRNIAGVVQRGELAVFVYGVIGGGGGERGTLPDPPPGEANALWPSGPFEMTFAGPVATGTGQVPDGRLHAKATETPTGRAEATATRIVAEGAFTVEAATVVSHTEPVEGGVQAESVSVLRQVTVGPLVLQSLVSRARAFVPAAGGDPTGIASTVIEGATVGGTPVQITDKGVVVDKNANPLGQEQVNKALADARFEQVRLLPSAATASDGGQAVLADAGVLEVVKQDQAFGASNPQGVSGGGFSLGGATAGITTVRCAPDCPEGLGLPEDSVPSDGDGDRASVEASSPPSDAGLSPPASEPVIPTGSGFSADASTSASFNTGGYRTGDGVSLPIPGEPSFDPSSSSSAMSPDLHTATGGDSQRAAPALVVNQPTTLAPSGMGPREAAWLRDLYLALGAGAGVLFVASRLAHAFR